MTHLKPRTPKNRTAALGDVCFQRRRIPQASRSMATVDRILEAARDLLEESSFSRVTTNHIADRAGVNISSLYQYFSSRESIAFALLEQVSAQTAATMREQVLHYVERDIDIAMPQMIDILVQLFKENASVLLRLMDELPELRQVALPREVNNLVVSIGRLYIEQHRPDMSPSDKEITYQFLANSTVANIRNYLIAAPDYISEAAFIRELSKSIVAYIRAA